MELLTTLCPQVNSMPTEPEPILNKCPLCSGLGSNWRSIPSEGHHTWELTGKWTADTCGLKEETGRAPGNCWQWTGIQGRKHWLQLAQAGQSSQKDNCSWALKNCVEFCCLERTRQCDRQGGQHGMRGGTAGGHSHASLRVLFQTTMIWMKVRDPVRAGTFTFNSPWFLPISSTSALPLHLFFHLTCNAFQVLTIVISWCGHAWFTSFWQQPPISYYVTTPLPLSFLRPGWDPLDGQREHRS